MEFSSIFGVVFEVLNLVTRRYLAVVVLIEICKFCSLDGKSSLLWMVLDGASKVRSVVVVRREGVDGLLRRRRLGMVVVVGSCWKSWLSKLAS